MFTDQLFSLKTSSWDVREQIILEALLDFKDVEMETQAETD